MSFKVINYIAKTGIRIFSKNDILASVDQLDIKETYVKRLLSLMAQKEEVISLGKGLYTLPPELLAGGPLHSFEIAMKLVGEGAISHRSAMFHHGLSDQMSQRVFITVPKTSKANRSTYHQYHLQGTDYYVIRINPAHYYGVEKVFINENSIYVTNIEKTLIDGLVSPKYCGGFREVLYAFEIGVEKSSADKLVEYAKKASLVACKRLGWTLDKLGVFTDHQEELVSISMNYPQMLDSSGLRRGSINKRWMVQENI